MVLHYKYSTLESRKKINIKCYILLVQMQNYKTVLILIQKCIKMLYQLRKRGNQTKVTSIEH